MAQPKFPRSSLDRALRIPRAILEQNAGHPSSVAETAAFMGIAVSGQVNTDVSSARKYGLIESAGNKLAVTDRAKKILRPQAESDVVEGMREAVLAAPELGEVYNHYRGEYLPEDTFLANTLEGTFGIPRDKLAEFKDVFLESLDTAALLDQSTDRPRLIDVGSEEVKRSSPAVARRTSSTSMSGSCFVVQPFGAPLGGYYETIYRPAIEQSGMSAMRADNEIFGTGKIMDQVWRGIRGADVLVAELTSRNPNVFYELGLAHALGKPVVLVSSNEDDVPFDLRHIRVIYYDVQDPFWGKKLIDKIADNVRSALQNPEEAILRIDEV